MEITAIYAITAGGILIALLFNRTVHLLAPLRGILSVLVSKHLTYPYFLNRHRFVGSWTRADVIICITYIAANFFCLSFAAPSSLEISYRAGKLSLVNMVFLFTAPHLGLLADILGVSLRLCRNIHRFTAWMGTLLLIIHILIVTLVDRVDFSLGVMNNIFAVIGSSSVALILLLSVPPLRRSVYECFIRSHQSLAGVVLYSTWRHLPSIRSLSGICIIVAILSLTLTSVLQAISFCYQNGFFTSRGYPKAYIYCDTVEGEDANSENRKIEKAVAVRVILPRAMKLDAGQYINLWMPTAGLFSCIQTHPFMVTSWSREAQKELDLYVKVQGGLSSTLYRKARDAPNGSVVFPAFVTGPHGLTEPIHQYESVLLIADGSGIAAVLPYLRKLIHGRNTMTCCTRRVHLVWQLHTLDMAVAAESSVNSLLKEDTLAKGYILTTSIYVESGTLVKLGDHERAFLYSGQPDYRAIVQAEVSGDFIKKTTNADEERGELLVMVSLSDENRDQVRSSVRECLEERVKMVELEYQPN